MTTYLSAIIQNISDRTTINPLPIETRDRIVLKGGVVSFVFKAIGNKALNGYSNEYEIHYPQVLQSFNVPQQELVKILHDINMTAIRNWPCMNCYYFGLAFSLVTCCVSYLIPHMCITDSENFVKDALNQYNKDYFHPKGLEILLKKNCMTSWLQLDILKSKEIANPRNETQNYNTSLQQQINQHELSTQISNDNDNENDDFNNDDFNNEDGYNQTDEINPE